MQGLAGQKRLTFYILLAVALCTLIPFLLTQIGVNYGPASRGGAGSHFAGFAFMDCIIRMDVATSGLLIFLTLLGVLHRRVASSRFTTIMAITLLFTGMAQTIQIVPCTFGPSGPTNFGTQVVRSVNLSYLGTGLLLFHGVLYASFGPRKFTIKTVLPALGISTLILGATWASMAGMFGSLVGHHHHLQYITFGLFLLTGILLRPQMNPQVLHFMKLGLTGMLIPLTAALLWMSFDADSIFDQGFHIAALLWWMALLMPVLGLCIDVINAYYGKGMSEEKSFLRKVIDAIPHYVFARDPHGQFTLVNKAVANFYGLSTGQIEGRHLSEIHLDREQRDQWLQEDQKILAEGKLVSMPENQASDAHGNAIWIDSIKTPLMAHDREHPQVLGISIDITRQKKAEIALAERLRFEQTATSVLQQFIRCNLDNFDDVILGILETVAQFTKGTRCYLYQFEEDSHDATLLHYWQEVMSSQATAPPAHLDSRDTHWLDHWFTLNKPFSVQRMSNLPSEAAGFRRIWGDAGERALIAIPIHNQGRLFGFLGLDSHEGHQWTNEEIVLLRNMVDLFITVWTKLETEKSLTRAMEEAQASSKAKSEFLANMSHEIRTPMNCVIGISDLLMEMEPTISQKQYLEMISLSGASLLTLINEILDLSKIEAGQLEIDPVETNLRTLVEEVAGLIAFNAQAKGLEMVCRYAPGAPDLVVCDSNRLRQVLTNLLNNAVKFTKEGHIYLNVEPVGMQDDQLMIQFRVADTGIGVPGDKLGKIFEKFTQADPSTTRRFGGTGLGLSISQQLVDLMGGKILAASTEGTGSTFSFTLPVSEVDDSLQAPPHVTPTESSILVISSHQLGCEVLAEQVRHLGYECITALGYRRGMKMLGSHKRVWSHILVDQDVLPEDAPLIQAYLDSLPAENRPRLLLMTSLSSILRESDLAGRGFNGTLTKPVRPGRLAEVLLGSGGIDTTTVAPIEESPVAMESAVVKKVTSADGPLVLLAEDNPFNQKVALGMLELLGCRVEVAINGIEALAMVKEKTFDLVFMDCQMPEMDGYEATKMIRKLPAPQCDTTIIAMTANALSGDRSACFTAGMNDFMSKPITKSMLGEMLAKWELVNV